MASVTGAVTQLPRLNTKTSSPVKCMPGWEPSIGLTTPTGVAVNVGAKCIGPASVGMVMEYLPDTWPKTQMAV